MKSDVIPRLEIRSDEYSASAAAPTPPAAPLVSAPPPAAAHASLLCGPSPLASLEEMKDTQASMLRLEQAALCEMACTVRLPLHEAHSS